MWQESAIHCMENCRARTNDNQTSYICGTFDHSPIKWLQKLKEIHGQGPIFPEERGRRRTGDLERLASIKNCLWKNVVNMGQSRSVSGASPVLGSNILHTLKAKMSGTDRRRDTSAPRRFLLPGQFSLWASQPSAAIFPAPTNILMSLPLSLSGYLIYSLFLTSSINAQLIAIKEPAEIELLVFLMFRSPRTLQLLKGSQCSVKMQKPNC